MDIGSSNSKRQVNTTLCCVAGLQSGAIAIIRLSGCEAFALAKKLFQPSALAQQAPDWMPQSHRIYHGHAVDESGNHIDEVGRS